MSERAIHHGASFAQSGPATGARPLGARALSIETAPMELDALTVDSAPMDWELEPSTIEEVDIKRVRFNDIVGVSLVAKPKKPDGEPRGQTAKYNEYARALRKHSSTR